LSRILEKLIVAQLDQEFPPFNGTGSFINACKNPPLFTVLSQMNLDHSTIPLFYKIFY
jgi:hypothetical protein